MPIIIPTGAHGHTCSNCVSLVGVKLSSLRMSAQVSKTGKLMVYSCLLSCKLNIACHDGSDICIIIMSYAGQRELPASRCQGE